MNITERARSGVAPSVAQRKSTRPASSAGMRDGGVREEISAELLDAGFLYVTLDLAGYKSGSRNAALKKGKSKKG